MKTGRSKPVAASALPAEIADLTHRLAAAEERCRQLDREKDEMAAQMARLKNVLRLQEEDARRLADAVDQQRQAYSDLQSRMEPLHRNLADREETVDALRLQLREMDARQEQQQRQLEQTQSEAANAQEELQVYNEELQVALENVERLNTELEDRVADRTRRLQEANTLLLDHLNQRKLAEQAAQRSEERLRFALEVARMVAWEWDLDADRILRSGHVPEFAGPPAAAAWERYEKLIHPEDRAWVRARVRQAIKGRTGFEAEYRLVRPADGAVVWVSDRAHLDVENGAPKRLTGITADISERKAAEQRQTMLLAELQHRVKNMLAMVRALAAQSLQSAGSLENFAESFNGRLNALAVTQALLTRSSDEEINLRELLLEELRPYSDSQHRPAINGGPDVCLTAHAGQTLGLAIHELATNAAKHGALSQPHGRLTIDWSVGSDGSDRCLELVWEESGLALPDGEPGRGFGRDLIQRGLAYQLSAHVDATFRREGLVCRISIPLTDQVGRVAGPAEPIGAA